MPQPAVWESFLSLWEQAGKVRNLLRNNTFPDQQTLLLQFLTALREFFTVDFCFGFLMLSDGESAEIGLPEAMIDRLPADFSRRCRSLVTNPTPVVWNEVSGQFGFRSTVLQPIIGPAGRSMGFLMLGHERRKSYSAAELFLLQNLAAEVSWVARELSRSTDQRQMLAAAGHDAKNALQVIIGNAALLRQKLNGAQRNGEENLRHIEAGAQQILDSVNLLSAADNNGDVRSAPPIKPIVNIASIARQAIDASRHLAAARGVEFVVVDGFGSPDHAVLDQPMLLGIFDTLIRNAALATRDETVRLTLRRDGGNLSVAVQGLGSNRVAEGLQSLFAVPSARREPPRNESGAAPTYVSKYLDSAGGDVYLKSRPGETVEFTVCLPFGSSAQPGRLNLEK